MDGHIPSPLFGLVMAATVIVILLTIFAWRWAVRRPLPGDTQGNPNSRDAFSYVAIGASDVVGVGATNPEYDNWAAALSRKLPEGTTFLRLARPGITLHEANRVEVPRAAEVRPDLVTIWNCVNDAVGGVSLPSYEEELLAALTLLLQNPATRVLVLNLPDIAIVKSGSLTAEQLELVRGGARQWNRAIDRVVMRFGSRANVFDMFEASEEAVHHPEYISSDGFHPGTAGYARIADLIWEEIVRLGWAPEAR